MITLPSAVPPVQDCHDVVTDSVQSSRPQDPEHPYRGDPEPDGDSEESRFERHTEDWKADTMGASWRGVRSRVMLSGRVSLARVRASGSLGPAVRGAGRRSMALITGLPFC